mmetsp:Transcript_25611/g.77318  ORF Transcript_25611/g.77318 Transcript_25611/m.77318 type:complete len:229 (-) Transcript_25611:349-1035(-)
MAACNPRLLAVAACLRLAAAADGDNTDYTYLEVASLERYPGYDGPLSVRGRIGFGFAGQEGDNASQIVNWDLSGTDPKCAGEAAAPGSWVCSIRLRSGTSCLSAALVGEDHWNRALVLLDPWPKVTYNTSNGWSRNGGVRVTTGFTNAEVVGRTVAVLDATGAGVACAVINATTTTTTTTSATATSTSTTTATATTPLAATSTQTAVAGVGRGAAPSALAVLAAALLR